MSDEAESSVMHPDFSDWMREVDVGMDRETLSTRWTTVSRIVNDVPFDHEMMLYLVQFVFGVDLPSDKLAEFQSWFKADDELFSMKEEQNRQELLALSSSILSLQMSGVYEAELSVAMAITTSLCGNQRSPQCGAQLISLANNVVREAAVAGRKRPRNNANFFIKESPDLLAHAKLRADPGDELHDTSLGISELDLVAADLHKSINALQKANRIVSDLDQHVRVKDEELDILWFVIVGYSEILDIPFAEISKVMQPIVCGLELAKKVSTQSEPPALRAILSKCLCEPNAMLSMNKISEGVPRLLDSIDRVCVEPYYMITPIYSMIESVRAAGIDSWEGMWIKNTGLNANAEQKSIDWAVQICREHIQLNHREV